MIVIASLILVVLRGFLTGNYDPHIIDLTRLFIIIIVSMFMRCCCHSCHVVFCEYGCSSHDSQHCSYSQYTCHYQYGPCSNCNCKAEQYKSSNTNEDAGDDDDDDDDEGARRRHGSF